MKNKLLDYIVSKKHHHFRLECADNFAEKFCQKGLLPIERMTLRFERMMDIEKPIILENELICFLRTIKNIPDIFTDKEWEEIKEKHYIHELGYMSNLAPNYEKCIKNGLLSLREDADEYGKRIIDAIIKLADRYKEEAQRIGRKDIADVLDRVPKYIYTCK